MLASHAVLEDRVGEVKAMRPVCDRDGIGRSIRATDADVHSMPSSDGCARSCAQTQAGRPHSAVNANQSAERKRA